MATISNVTISPRRASGGVRVAPRKIFAGRTRTEIRKTIAKLQALINSDNREARRGSALGYDVVLIFGVANSSDNNAFKKVMARLNACMRLKTGDE